MNLEIKILALTFYETHKAIQAQTDKKHSYYHYFSALNDIYMFIENEFEKHFFYTMDMQKWRNLAKEKAFKDIVKIETLDRYAIIDENKPCDMNENQARELAKSLFYEENKKQQHLNNFTMTQSRRAVYAELSKHNFKYDYTEVINITFNEDIIKQIQAELPDIVTAIRAAILL